MNFSALLCVASVVVAAIQATGCTSTNSVDEAQADVNASSDITRNSVPSDPLFETVSRPVLPPTLTSGLTVPASETFHLGERQTGAFTVSARNRGEVTVRLILAREGERSDIATLAPGETVVGKFASGDGVLVRNLSDDRDASLSVEVWGTRNLAMYYTDNEPADRDDD